jgi:hypothetical protein
MTIFQISNPQKPIDMKLKNKATTDKQLFISYIYFKQNYNNISYL